MLRLRAAELLLGRTHCVFCGHALKQGEGSFPPCWQRRCRLKEVKR